MKPPINIFQPVMKRRGEAMRRSWLNFAGIFLLPFIVTFTFFLRIKTWKFTHNFSDSNHSLGQCCHLVGSIFGQMLSNDISTILFRLSGRLNRQRLVRNWSYALSPTIPAYANVMTITLSIIAFDQRWSDMISGYLFIIIRKKNHSISLVSMLATIYFKSWVRMAFRSHLQ